MGRIPLQRQRRKETVPVTKEALDAVALTPREYEAIVERLGREPNDVELGMFGSLWSEHCGYKHSKPLLRLFPSEGPRLLVRPGVENAGAVDIGGGLAAVFKMESHNHPSAVEPYQGAATGVGGIVRDILAMGARPIALLNSLRFGPLKDPRNRYLFQGVVGGISGYGNCIGVPDVGGEVHFAPSYSGNPLVNALCLGIVRADRLLRAAATRPDDLLVLVGSETGRDGIHGASGLASRTFEEEREQRPAVQVGNPFLEKVLIEACLEAAEAGLLEGLQDLGAAGLTSSTVECAEKGGTGIELDVALVPRRETGMTPYEVMLSESQERMLLIVRPENLGKVKAVFDKWDTPCTVIGKVTDTGMARILEDGWEVALLPVSTVTHPPLYELDAPKPPTLSRLQAYDLAALPLPAVTPGELLLRLLASPNIASKESVYRQYDHQVQTNTVLGPAQADAAVLRIKGTERGLALTTDGNGRLCSLDPYTGGAIAIAEACRNLACAGATPVAITDCLNFGDPERPLVAYQLRQAVLGMAKACEALGVPVVSGNVSLYNETRGEPVYPTPAIGALGILEDVAKHCPSAFQQEGDVVVLLGASQVTGDAATLAGSECLEVVHDLVAGQPAIDLELEARVQRACLRAISEGLLHSAHDCSEGGLAVALAECAIQASLGFAGEFSVQGRWDAALFGEAQSRIVVSLPQEVLPRLEALCTQESVPYLGLGTVGGGQFSVPGLLDAPLEALADAWRNGLERAAGDKVAPAFRPVL
ncbi:MAG: phosphoribosylformylglycinamidine synthase subunit PurL [Chloroflexi bacterium]|nr:phosphoribosylformylglycinamidine synthase subunit PurL [Chloroflexota bacterium]